MTDSERPPRRGRGRPRRGKAASDATADADPYREPNEAPEMDAPNESSSAPNESGSDSGSESADSGPSSSAGDAPPGDGSSNQNREQNGRPWQDRGDRDGGAGRNGRGRRGRRQRGRGRGRDDRPNRGGGGGNFDGSGNRNERFDRGGDNGEQRQSSSEPPVILVVDGETTGWFDPARDAGFIRRAEFSYLNEPGDAWLHPALCRQYNLRRGDQLVARTGRDQRGRLAVAELVAINGAAPDDTIRRTEFGTLTASYPERHLTLETGKPAKVGPELTRRSIDLIAPIGFGHRALIVAPARAGKTMLMQAITEGIAINHPSATLLILLVDERPEEVSEAISWGVGEVIASSFDQPAKRHVEVVEMVIERSRRLVEQGQDVIIVLDSLTRMARAFNTAERGTGRTLSGGLDTSAMAKPKAFFGSARNILPQHGGGSLTIIATALVETGSRMDDVIFVEFKGTGNCEIMLARGLAEKRIFPAFDIATSGTRREEKLYKAEQIDAIYTLRRGLQQMPPQSGMEWLIKRIAGTTSNDALLAGL
jgi:transcription termination factor Rho